MTTELNLTGDKAREELRKLRDRYQQAARPNKFNALVYGKTGTGKTHMLSTARYPILIHSFDPNGTTTLRGAIPDFDKKVQEGQILIEKFEHGTLKQPIFRDWERRIKDLERAGVFDVIATFALDSLTSWFMELQASIMLDPSNTNKADVFGHKPMRIQDWGTIWLVAADWIKALMAKQPDFILIGHVGLEKDEVTGQFETILNVGGKSKDGLFQLFDEVYLTQTKTSSKGLEYTILTANDGRYQAKTRIGAGGKFNREEEPNIKNLLRKAGLPNEDMPALNLG